MTAVSQIVSKARAETAREINREEAGGAPAFVLGVPLMDDRQMYYLRILAERGIVGETPGEVAAHFITNGIMQYVGNKCAEGARLYPPETWKGFKP
jgi:hypothetical protein